VLKIFDIKHDNFSTFIDISNLLYLALNGLKMGLFQLFSTCKQQEKTTQKIA